MQDFVNKERSDLDKIYVTRPFIPSFDEYAAMLKVLWENKILTNMGILHNELQKKLGDLFNVPYVSLMVNGHMALEIAIQSMKFPRGSEIITSPYTFVSTTNAIVRSGCKPVFCDIKYDDYTIDETKIEKYITKKTAAILPVHVYGNICNVNGIKKIAEAYGLKVIYDAAHAFGEYWEGKSSASFGDISIMSFHATKVFNTIEGGAVFTESEEINSRIRDLRNFGFRDEELVVDIGTNAKMNEFSSAMGLCNLKYLDFIMGERKKKADYYSSKLKHISVIKIPEYKSDIKYNYGYYPILFKTDNGFEIREDLYAYLKNFNIYTRKYFYPITADQECYGNIYKDADLKTARYVSQRILLLPLYVELENTSIDKICDLIIKRLEEIIK